MSEDKSQTIVDCHTHLWESAAQLGKCSSSFRLKSNPSASRLSSSYDLIISAEPVTVSFLLGFHSRLLDVNIPNKFIADCSYQYRGKIIGFGSIDPSEDNVVEEAERILKNYNLAGFVISPAAQGFHPCSSQAMPLYDYAREHNTPIIIHNGQPFGSPSAEFSNPIFWTQILRDYPQVNFVFTDMGWPWIDQLLLLLAEYENVYTDTASLVQKQWAGYQTLVKADQMGVIDKFFLASDFPASNSAATIEAIYNINQLASNTNLPIIARQKLRGIVERDVLEILGLKEKLELPSETR